ncbi:MAG: TIGR03936 family radical SAM-associated protein [Ruminococcus sp.]|jgi:radical SAM-linked protein|nr:TIGR03936 family radical SAM-associated protein [Ruminococcus sp.]
MVEIMAEKFSYYLTFEKKDIAVYTSHLDVVRVFSRAFARSKLPICFTEGFTKRPYLIFPYPLPLGTAGENEILEFKTHNEIYNENDFMSSINNYLPSGFKVSAVFSNSIPRFIFAEYEILYCDHLDTRVVKSFIDRDRIEAKKFSKKKGTVVVDLKAFIKDIEIRDNGDIRLILPVGENNNINVNVFINALSEYTNLKPELFCAKRLKFINSAP